MQGKGIDEHSKTIEPPGVQQPKGKH
jgi:hypothetical protein